MHQLSHPLNDTRSTPFVFRLAGAAFVFCLALYFVVDSIGCAP
jgi:hypothetical protein